MAALAGLMMTVAIVAITRPDAPAPSPRSSVSARNSEGKLARELDRCATLTMPDSGCEAAWAENRRRFFAKDAAAPEPEIARRADTTQETAP
ncbi:putative entry exclusion protein TrbK-alt [Novosphingobium sp. SG720]|uniref:putative entry exclusion protein TrbK-alt n=1 Tax=Novosphingobium sp. SG720 TaxID=2586998 RepID=UPI0017B6DB09|nr:conjugative transfer region protein TrbK [Novosphingobium sp. SG720]